MMLDLYIERMPLSSNREYNHFSIHHLLCHPRTELYNQGKLGAVEVGNL